jgi:putative hydrolase of the HAD superfamily
VCFDIGGVLVRICRNWTEGCAAAGLDVRGRTADTDWGGRRRGVARDFSEGRIDVLTFSERLAAATEHLYTPAEVLRIHNAWLLNEYAGIHSLMDRLLTTPNVDTGILSNTNDLHWRRDVGFDGLSTFPIMARPRHRHASHLLGLMKPDERIYRAFEQHSGYRAGEILFFDDLEENIAAARTLGWRAEQIDHTGDTPAQMARHLVTHGVWTDSSL